MIRKIIIAVAIVTIIIICFFLYLLRQAPAVEIKNFGVTFSKMQAEHLGLDWQKAYESIFSELGVKRVRIPVYWSEVEKEEGIFDFSDIDWMVDKAAEYDGRVILVVGKKVPRWPECHEPEWVKSQIPYEAKPRNNLTRFSLVRLLGYMQKTIERYDKNSVVWAWQVENEPFLDFGVCSELDVGFLDEEIKLVRSLSEKPVIMTDSGEFGMWWRAYKRADIFGTTMYRIVFNKNLGYLTYPLPPLFFRLKQAAIEMFFEEKPAVVIELQAEAWGPKLIYEVTTEENYKSFNPEEFKKILEYIKGTGFDTFYFWGYEWWYWLKEKENKPEMWNIAKEAIKNIKN